MPIEFQPPSANLQGYQITSPQSVDPLQTLAQMGQLRTQNLQQQTAQMGLEQERMKLDSNKGLLKAMTDAGTQGTPEEIFQRTLQNATRPGSGVLPGDVIGLHQHYNQLLQEAATRKKTELENQGADIDRLQGIYEPLTRPGATDQDFADANAKADALGIDKRIPRLTQWTDPAHVEAFSNGLSLHSKILAEAKTKAETEASQAAAVESGAKTGQAQATTAETQLKTKQLQSQLDWMESLTPKTLGDYVGASIDKTKYPDLYARAYNDASNARAMRKPELLQAAIDKYATIASEQEKTIATETNPQVRQARTDQAVATARATSPILIDRATGMANAALGATPGGGGPGSNLHGEEYLSTLNNPALAAKVRAITRGDDDLPTGRAAASGAGALLANAVYQYDPNYTRLLAQKRKTELQDFSKTAPGSAGGNVVALNTMIHHGDLYQETADALDNGTFKPGNAAWNAVKDAFGKAPPTQANLVAQFLAGETAKVAGENTGGAVNDILQNLKNSNSPEQIRAAGRTLIGIAAGRMVPYQERIADAKLENLAPPLLGPSAKAILVRRGFDPNTMKPVQQGGGGGLQYVRTSTGANGHRIGQTADGKWHDAQTGSVIQ